MTLITKTNLSAFLEYYHSLHDSYITNINYNITNSQIELLIDIYWSGKLQLNEDGTYKTNKVKLKMNLNGVEQCNIKEMFSWNYINEVYIQYVKVKNQEFICFASDKEEPLVYILCDNIEYEELKED